jgi:hypothetical protein
MGEVPAWASTARTLLHGGNVYSPADPFATAMLVVGPEIAWIGSEGAALAMADGVDEVVDLAGRLVLPGFVDLYPPSQAARADGVVLRVGAQAPTAPGPLGVARPAALVARDADEASELIRAAAGQSPAERGERILVLGGLHAADVGPLSGTGAAACLIPDESGSLRRLPVASLAAAGVLFGFGSGPTGTSPWATIAAAVNHPDPDQRISARAAFAAHTRGGWRVLGEPGSGTLVEGAPAHYTVWDAGPLVVQAPDDRIQAWSTDPRSGTPGLPDVSPGAPSPVCLRTAVWGRTIGPA